MQAKWMKLDLSIYVHDLSAIPPTHVGYVLDLGNKDMLALFISRLNSQCLSVDPVGFSLYAVGCQQKQ